MWVRPSPSRLSPELVGLIKDFARTLALTPGTHKPGTMLCAFVELIAAEYEFRNPRSLVFMLLRILTLESSWIGVETRKVLAELLAWGVRRDPRLVSPFLKCYRDHGRRLQQLRWNALTLGTVPMFRRLRSPTRGT